MAVCRQLHSTNIEGSIPESIGNLTSLKSLHISNMCTKGVPASFERLTSLTSLKLEQRVQNVDSNAAKLSREQEVRVQLQVLSRYFPAHPWHC